MVSDVCHWSTLSWTFLLPTPSPSLVSNAFTISCMLSCFSHLWLFGTLYSVACQTPLSMEILQVRILEWIAMPLGYLPNPRMEPTSFMSLALAGGFFTTSTTWEDPLLPHLWAGLSLASQSCLTLCSPIDCSLSDSSVRGDSPGKNTGVGCHALLQEIFLVQGWNPGLPHCRLILYHISHQGSPRILE